MRFKGVAALLACAAAVGGCASMTEGSTQTLTFSTEPSGAVCELNRKGQTLGVVNPTPGQVMVGKSKDPIDVTCRKDGYENVTQAVGPDNSGMGTSGILWSLLCLICGPISVGVDASSGAMYKYPESVIFLMPPTSFASEGDRDAFYTRLKSDIADRAEAARVRATYHCPPDFKKQCNEEADKILAARDAEIDKWEQRRLAAKVGA